MRSSLPAGADSAVRARRGGSQRRAPPFVACLPPLQLSSSWAPLTAGGPRAAQQPHLRALPKPSAGRDSGAALCGRHCKRKPLGCACGRTAAALEPRRSYEARDAARSTRVRTQQPGRTPAGREVRACGGERQTQRARGGRSRAAVSHEGLCGRPRRKGPSEAARPRCAALAAPPAGERGGGPQLRRSAPAVRRLAQLRGGRRSASRVARAQRRLRRCAARRLAGRRPPSGGAGAASVAFPCLAYVAPRRASRRALKPGRLRKVPSDGAARSRRRGAE
jgi:hypothetical protein